MFRKSRTAAIAAARFCCSVRPERTRGLNEWSPSSIHAIRIRCESSYSSTSLAAAEAVACALYDERWSPQRRQMLEPGARRFAGRMEGIAEADQASDLSLVRHHAGDAAAQGFAADYELPASAERLNYLAPRSSSTGSRAGVLRARCSRRARI